MTNVSFPHWQRHNQRRSRSRLRSSERRTTVSLPKTCPVMSVATPATPSFVAWSSASPSAASG
jgi:hypothetical protein